MKKKLNTKLFSSGAEFLVLSKLLLAGIETYKVYENQEGYDLISVNSKNNLSAKIQVKSKNMKGDTSFYVNSIDKKKSDFYVFAQTNSLDKKTKKIVPDSEAKPKLYVFDFDLVQRLKKIDSNGTSYISVSPKNHPNIEDQNEDWEIIKKFLKINL